MFARYKKLLTVLGISLLFLCIGSMSQAKTTINFGSWKFEEPGQAELLRKNIKEFERQNPDVEIKEVQIPWTKYMDKLSVEFAGGGGPDALHLRYLGGIPFLSKDYLLPLNNLIEISKYEGVFFERFYKEIQDDQGRVYGLPFELVNYGGLLYNERFFKETGLSVPNTPDELIKASEKIVENTDATFGLIHYMNPADLGAFVDGGLIRIWYPYGARIARKGKFTVDEPQFMDALKFTRKLWDSPGTPVGMPMGQQRIAFDIEKAAMQIDAQHRPFVTRAQNPEFYENRLKVARLPFPCRYHKAESNYLVLNPNSPDSAQRIGAKFIEYLVSPSVQLEWGEAVGPARVVLWKKIVEKYPWYQVFLEELPYAVSQFVEGHEVDTLEIRTILGEWAVKGITGEISIEEAMEKCKAELEKQFGSPR